MYVVNYSNRADSNTIKEFATLTEAKLFCEEFFEGREKYDGDENDDVSWCRLEVFEVLPDGNINEVHSTESYWEE